MTTFGKVAGSRRFDLPPKWDGRDVEWEPWAVLQTTFRFHARLSELVCRKCGSLAPQASCRGVIDQAEGDSVVVPLARWRILYASRCTDCAHDTVYDMTSDELWDLDDTDYGPDGSHDPGQLQGSLF